MPRTVASGGHAVSTLTFDGKSLVLTDDASNTIEVPATSGLKPTHHRNPAKIDYTDPKWEWEPGKGPIPGFANYVVEPGQSRFRTPTRAAPSTPAAATPARWRFGVRCGLVSSPTRGRTRARGAAGASSLSTWT